VGDLLGLIVFDLDGTLIDSRRDLADAANALIEERGGAPLAVEAVGRMVGDGAGVLVRRAMSAAGLAMDESSLPRFLELYDQRLLRTTRPYDGIEEALALVRAWGTLAVLTNKPIGPTRTLLAALGLEASFAAAVGGDGPLPRKPDPEGLRHLMSMFDAPAGRTVLVGDSHIDAATARAAGVRFCLAAYGYGAEALDEDVFRSADAIVNDPVELPRAVGRLVA
jgi:phosphoglycolate phosphatase